VEENRARMNFRGSPLAPHIAVSLWLTEDVVSSYFEALLHAVPEAQFLLNNTYPVSQRLTAMCCGKATVSN
jgi:hypothetical protein